MISLRTCRDALINASALIALLLISVCAVAAAPDGQWWNADYPYRQQLSIDPGNSDLSAGYSTQLTFNHAAEVAANRSLANGNDVRIVRWNQSTSTWTELDRVLDTQSSWNDTSTTLWFANAALIEDDETSTDYYIYFGNVTPDAPLQDPEQVFLLFDAFLGSALDTNRWTSTGSPSVSADVLTLPVNASIRSRDSFDIGTVWEARIAVPTALPNGGSHSYDLWLGIEGSDLDDAHVGFIAEPGEYNAVSQRWITWPEEMTVANPTLWNTYSFARDGGSTVRYQIGGGAEETINWWFAVSDGAMNAFARNNANGSRELRYDWVRIRQYRRTEPDIDLLGAREQYAPLGEWQMEESAWNGSANEVKDSRSLGLHLTSVQSGGSGANTALTSPALPGSPGSCRYGVFDGTNDYLQRADHTSLDITSRLTMMAWIRPAAYAASGNLKNILSKDTNYEIHLNSAGQVNWWWQSGGATRELTTAVSVPLNQWSHIAATYEAGVQRIYINGVVRASGTFSGNLNTNNLPLQIGQDQGLAGRFWNGYIDEVQVYDRVLSGAQITAAMNAVRVCAGGTAKLAIEHDGYGIHCAAETIKVHARDAANNPNTSYSSQIRLDTGTGRGSWALISGSGSFSDGTSDDGVATYTWPLGQSVATFTLLYREGASPLDIDAYQISNTTVRDDDSEGTLAFTQSGFTVTSSPLTNPAAIAPFASPQTAGQEFQMHITAYGQTPDDPTCGVIESYTGAKQLQFWSTYVNPSTGSVNVDINGPIGTSEATASNRSVTFTAGQAVVATKYKDVGKLAIHLKDVASNPEITGGARGGTGDLIVKPHTLVLADLRRTDTSMPVPAASSATSAVFLAAGAPFTGTLTARDFEGSATPNFGKETPLPHVLLPTTVIAPSGAGVQNPDVQTNGFVIFNNGAATVTDLSWAEVGIMRITPRVSNYLNSGSDVIGQQTANIGRFVPADLRLSVEIPPALETACASGGFTYLGQPFFYSASPVVRVTAVNTGGTTTVNYRGDFFKVGNAALDPVDWRIYSEASGFEVDGAPDKNADPVIVPQNDGTGLLAYSSGSGLKIARTAPTAPFNAQISLRINVKDADNVASSDANFLVSSSPALPAIPFSGGSEFRYGRLAFRNALGSELIDLPTPLRAEYFVNSATGFAVNTNDMCTTSTPINLSGVNTCVRDVGDPGNSSAGCSAPSANPFRSTALAGDFNLILAAPGQGNHGIVELQAPTAPDWLRYDWDSTSAGEETPTGTATFGVFQGNSRRIDQRERF
jgi:MSHA biogenesis protein MshQ